MKNMIEELQSKVINNNNISFEEAIGLSQTEDIESLLAAANDIRIHFNGSHMDLCTIMNAKSGRCTEDCKYCAQSGYYNTGIECYPLVGAEQALNLARDNEKAGVHRFSLVTSGADLSPSEFEQVICIYKMLKRETKLQLCASLGNITRDMAIQLSKAGVSTYHHNLETSRSYFSNICTTHTYESRIETIKNVQSAGLNICSGGILGMGESMEHRIEMAFELRELGINSIPINILNAIKGTPFQDIKLPDPMELLKSIAMFRFILPHARIRYAGGRAALGEYQALGLQGGVNAVMIGNYLTTVGSDIESDFDMIEKNGFTI